MTAFRIEPLAAAHDRSLFSSGNATLDRYLREFAAQDMRRRISNCFVALDSDDRIAGYYTLSASGLSLADLPLELARKMPRYGLLPAALLGRLAVDEGRRRQGLGLALVADAVDRAARSAPAIFALIVDAKDDNAITFYEQFGFTRLTSRPMSLFLSVASALSLLDR